MWKSMKENGRETLRALVLCGLAARLRDSKAIIRSTQPAGRFALNVSINSAPKISHSSFSNSASTPKNIAKNTVQLLQSADLIPDTLKLNLGLLKIFLEFLGLSEEALVKSAI